MARKKRQMTKGTCRKVRGKRGVWICRLKTGKVRFRKKNIYRK